MDNPYKGLIAYTQEDSQYFFGRDQERKLVASNLRASRLTVLIGASGVGKSSVLNAGVAVDLSSNPDYTLVIFRSWHDDPRQRLTETLCDAVPELSGTLADGQLPRLAELLTAWANQLGDQSNRKLLVILDQFEEYFQYHPRDGGQHSFFEEFPTLLACQDLPVNFLISIRDDSLALLDRFKGRIPKLFQNYLRINHLSRSAAKEAILRPLERFNELHPTSRVSMTEAQADLVIEHIVEAQITEQEFVQAAYLQLVMSRWWNFEVDHGSGAMRDATLLGDLGDVANIVNSHLKETIDRLSSAEQQEAAIVFRHLVTSSGRKQVEAVSELGAITKLDSSKIEELLKKLDCARIVIRVPAPRGVAATDQSYEFAHDLVAKAALDWRIQYEKDKERVKRFRQIAVVLTLSLAVAFGVGAFEWKAHTQSIRLNTTEKTLRAAFPDDKRDRNAGDFPLYLETATREMMQMGTGDRVLIMLDFIGHGHYSAPEDYAEYIKALKQATQRGASVQILIYGVQQAKTNLDSQFVPKQFVRQKDGRFGFYDPETESFKRYNHYVDYYRSRGWLSGPPSTYRDFVNDVIATQNRFCQEVKSLPNVNMRTIETEERPYFWIFSNGHALLAYPRYRVPLTGYSFITQDTNIIEIYKTAFIKEWRGALEATDTDICYKPFY